ncbi:hypothetical protein EW145_g1495 [Phellinidium pouzarii]|uniref:GrpE protein homolog, mitochondrial n=1 Tax=Phellinidium pouzarii TaxID=167371 RepID=A0A4S4LEU4_9AGAM|nr:hypothetical protein EW145_g1495 [Phellinidium pouzarii]
MSRTHALSILRQCTVGLLPAIAPARRRVVVPRSFATARARQYSTQGEKDGETEIEKGNDAGKKDAEGNSSSEPSHSSAIADCEKKLKAKEEDVVDLTSRLRYLQADFLNLQRNSAREKEQTKDFAITRFAGDLLETVDVLSLALKSIPESALKPPADAEPSTSSASTSNTSDPSSESLPPKSPLEYLKELHHGVEMTHRQLLQTLFKFNVKPFDPTGDAFDPNRHEALYQAPILGKTPGTVIQCQKIGFTIKDRTLRAAQVGVASESS